MPVGLSKNLPFAFCCRKEWAIRFSHRIAFVINKNGDCISRRITQLTGFSHLPRIISRNRISKNRSQKANVFPVWHRLQSLKSSPPKARLLL